MVNRSLFLLSIFSLSAYGLATGGGQAIHKQDKESQYTIVQPEQWLTPQIISAPIQWEKLEAPSMCNLKTDIADDKRKVHAFWNLAFVQSFTSFRDCINKREIKINLGHLIYANYPNFYFYIQASEGMKPLLSITKNIPSVYKTYDFAYNHPIILRLNMLENKNTVYDFPYWLPDRIIKTKAVECFNFSTYPFKFDKNYSNYRDFITLKTDREANCDIRFLFDISTNKGKYEFKGRFSK